MKQPTIYEMETIAKKMIEDGDDHGLLALYWIRRWAKADQEGGIVRDPESKKPSQPHPSNIAHRFNYPADLNHDWVPGAAWTALCDVWEKAGGRV